MFSFHLDVGWGTALLLLGIPALVIYLFVAANIIAYDYAKRQSIFKKPNVAVIKIAGILRYSTRANSSYMRLMRQIEWVREKKPKALLVVLNTPGGSTVASHEIYVALKSLKKNGIRVVAHMEDIATSGGVYVAMAADKIMAVPTTITGSIGVIMPRFDFSELLKFLKVKSDNVAAGDHKEIGSFTKPMKPESRAILEEMLRSDQEIFWGIVAENRNLPIEKVREFGDGRIFNGVRAKELGLIDEIGSYADAETLAATLGEVSDEEREVAEVPAPGPFFEKLGILPGVTALVGRAEDLVASAEADGVPMYLWKK